MDGCGGFQANNVAEPEEGVRFVEAGGAAVDPELR